MGSELSLSAPSASPGPWYLHSVSHELSPSGEESEGNKRKEFNKNGITKKCLATSTMQPTAPLWPTLRPSSTSSAQHSTSASTKMVHTQQQAPRKPSHHMTTHPKTQSRKPSQHMTTHPKTQSNRATAPFSQAHAITPSPSLAPIPVRLRRIRPPHRQHLLSRDPASPQ